MFTSACYLSLSCSRSIQSIPLHPTSWIFVEVIPLCLKYKNINITYKYFVGLNTYKLYLYFSTSWRSILILSSHKGSVQAQGTCICFVTTPDLWWGFVSTTPNPQAGRPPLVGCLQLLIQYIHSYPPYWRLLLHLQPEDTPCHGDRHPLIMATWLTIIKLVCVREVAIHKPTQQLNKLSGWPWTGWPGFDLCQGLLPQHPEQL